MSLLNIVGGVMGFVGGCSVMFYSGALYERYKDKPTTVIVRQPIGAMSPQEQRIYDICKIVGGTWWQQYTEQRDKFLEVMEAVLTSFMGARK